VSTTTAADALTKLTAAIDTVAAQRGTLGAAINQLTSATNVMNTQVQNLQSAENSVMNADIGKTVANMTQYNVLQSTGMAALQQSNQAQQAVLKLVQ
jgi:flagellin